ncbi:MULTISPECIES: DUF7118 family protein [Halolamina]|uniref:Uncharacterized protein n=1 Tax=Halolamina pelagica TaxID=699431 RepID=A0A1I5SJM4_9EURY|nr:MULTISPECIES: hypothetical protein [Halolamina]NHX37027.1 hypothetical protein [Halolamina sp. R1-12]SFP70994.1 hypothetical protein SAMN05216277_106151 [Halolamina pelagica]
MSVADEPVPAEPTTDDLLAELGEARAEREEIAAEIDRHGEAAVQNVAEAVDEATRLLDRYVDSATGTGDFEAYLEFQSQFAELVENLPEELPDRDGFEEANEAVDQRTISESDFQRAREAIEGAREIADLLDRREAAQRRVDDAERAVSERRAAIERRLDELAELRRLGDADLSAPTAELTAPIERYDEAVRDDFAAFVDEAPVRELLGFVETTRHYPLIDYQRPPKDLLEYVRNHPAGEEPLPTLLSYADYSGSKLSHYVEDPTAFETTVPVHRTYLDRIDAGPLTVGSPPPAAELRYLATELVSVVARFADEETVALARDLRDLARRDDYDRLRDAVVAEAELTADQREALREGEIEAEAERLREARERLTEALN